MTRRICVVTAGHLATCPRMLKAADALHAAGYCVRVVSTRTTGWAAAADASIATSRGWQWDVVNYDRTEAPATWLRSGARQKAARALAGVMRVPRTVAAVAFGRVHRELVKTILRAPADLIYGGTTGAIAAVAEAGRRANTPFAVDFEDFHCAEHDSPEGDLSNRLGRDIMWFAADGAAFVTAGSGAIARACRDDLGITAIAINNVFQLPDVAPADSDRNGVEDEFAAYWFSQTIGPGRGLEDVIRALGLTARRASLTLRGCPVAGYIERLKALAGQQAPRMRLLVESPSDPARMVDACRAFDLGIAAEQGQIRNRLLSLPNKATTYPLAGLPVALTDTAGQQPLAMDLGAGALVFAPGDAASLAEQLLPLMTDANRRAEARAASWRAARTRWHWEHEHERGALLAAVERTVS